MASPVTPEMQSKITAWRHRAADGKLSLDEMKEAVKFLRAGRVAAASSAIPASKRAAAKAAIPSAESMLDELGDI